MQPHSSIHLEMWFNPASSLKIFVFEQQTSRHVTSVFSLVPSKETAVPQQLKIKDRAVHKYMKYAQINIKGSRQKNKQTIDLEAGEQWAAMVQVERMINFENVQI